MTVALWPPLGQFLPDAGEFTDSDSGRTWTVNGESIFIPYPESPRVTLADAFTTAIGVSTGVQVYSSPPETPVPPAVVIRPADPYQAPYTASGGAGSAWAFEVDIILRRNDSEAALAAIERAREVLVAALPAGWRWVEFGDIGEIVVAKKAYLKGTLGVAVAYTGGLDNG